MELLLVIICISALIGFAIGVASGYMIATLGTTNQKPGVFSDKKDCVRVTAPIEISHQENIIVDELFQFNSSGDWWYFSDALWLSLSFQKELWEAQSG